MDKYSFDCLVHFMHATYSKGPEVGMLAINRWLLHLYRKRTTGCDGVSCHQGLSLLMQNMQQFTHQRTSHYTAV